jgi:hypothetical protein
MQIRAFWNRQSIKKCNIHERLLRIHCQHIALERARIVLKHYTADKLCVSLTPAIRKTRPSQREREREKRE